ncbi:hypothetical protein T02_7751 [Trichinella nativa]|uniref:Uncharacterized protein n=1 Tax=Trichinella nativa TaxID=6335 RepID=A0A0V1KJ24_9BILA|nr:hypothetical protein T02_7751 [Trichinella nativa]
MMVAYFNLIFCVLIIGDTNYCSSTSVAYFTIQTTAVLLQ